MFLCELSLLYLVPSVFNRERAMCGKIRTQQRAAEGCKCHEFGQRIAHGMLILSVDTSMQASKIKLGAFSRVTTGCGSFGRCESATRCTSD